MAYRELTQHFPRPGWVEHDADEIWAAVRATLAELGGRLAAAGARVAAIGITNQRETLVAFDRSNGRPLHRAIVWQDRRTAPMCDELRRAGHLPLVRERTGLVLDPYFSATKAAWLLGSGELALAADDPDLSFCTVDAWVLWNLTGGPGRGVYATDPSNASRTMLFDTADLAWSPELCEIFGVPPHTLPEVRPSAYRFGTAALGGLSASTAALDGVPVAAILGDQQAALFGQACFSPGMVKVTYGTGSFVLANAGPERPAAPEGLTVSCAWDFGDHSSGRERVTYALEGSAFVSGAAIQWLRDGLGIIESAAEVGPLAASVPDSGGVVFVPALTGLGSPQWDPAARGTVTGITRGTSRAHLARACVEAMAFQVRDMTDAMAAASPHPITALRADGGAAAMDLLPRASRPNRAARRSPARAHWSRPGWAQPPWPAWPKRVSRGSLDELAALWGGRRRVQPPTARRRSPTRWRTPGGARAGPRRSMGLGRSGHLSCRVRWSQLQALRRPSGSDTASSSPRNGIQVLRGRLTL